MPILLFLEDLEYGVPEKPDIAQAVSGIKGEKAGGPLGMWSEGLKVWLQEASREKNPVRRPWKLLVRPIQSTFEDGLVIEEVVWETMVLLPKRKMEYQRIGLVGVVWKVSLTVVNC